MHSRLIVFEFSHVLDLICTHLATIDLIHCTQVSSLWNFIFQPQLLRHIQFVDLKKEKTWDILDHASRIQSLKIDIADGGWFLIDSSPTTTTTIPSTSRTKTTPPCINLGWLHCVDFGYFTNPIRPTDERYGEWAYPDPTPTVMMNRTKPHASAGDSTNALRLIQQNPKLHSLTIKHGRQTYGVDHFTPHVLQSISTHLSMTLLDIQLNFDISLDFLEALLRHLPLQLQELRVCVNEFVAPLSANDINHHHHSTHSTASPETTIIPAPGCLRKICLRTNTSGPESLWEEENARTWWDHYFQSPSYPEKVILPRLRHSPRLQELVLGGYSGRAQHLVQTLFESCPDLEVLDLGGSDSNFEHAGFTYAGDEPLAEGRMLSKLRTFRLRSHTYSWRMQDQIALSEIMVRSASTLEVVWLEASDSERGWATLSPFCMRRAEEGERLTFPRLKELVIRAGRDWVYPDTATRQQDHQRESDENHETHGLGSVPLFTNFPLLERLSLFISDAAPSECEGCNGSPGPGHKDKTQKEFLERQRLERQECHQQQFASRFRQLVSNFRSCAGLKKLELHWQLCDTIRDMTREDLFERANNDHIGELSVGSRSDVEASEGGTGKESAVAKITTEDLDWMDLLSLPTRAQVAQKKAFKAKARRQKEWEKEVLEALKANLPITRYSDPLDPLYRRVGRGWQDWESLAGKCGYGFELAMKQRAARCSGSGGGRWEDL